jgi:hypothetical protein
MNAGRSTATRRSGGCGLTVRLSKAPPYWARPSLPLGYNEPAWPTRMA